MKLHFFLIVDFQTTKLLLDKCDKTTTTFRHDVRHKYGLMPRALITTYHMAGHMNIPVKALETALKKLYKVYPFLSNNRVNQVSPPSNSIPPAGH
ncbi:MAG: hypothetical protein ABIP95_15320 [Pelobium sp.]